MNRGFVNVNRLNLRTTPGGAIMDVLDQGTELGVLGLQGDWLKVLFGNLQGWVSGRYITLIPAVKPDPPQEEIDAPDNVPSQPEIIGSVTTARLNFRDAPDGRVIGTLVLNDQVSILERYPGWLKVNALGKTGYVSASYIRQEPVSPIETARPRSDPGVFHYEGNKLFSDKGELIGRKHAKGIFNYGETSISDFLSKTTGELATLTASQIKVMQAVSENEGKFEAINTWDNAFLSIGLFQWTAGTGADAGELPALLDLFQNNYSPLYDEYFKKFGLETINVKVHTGDVARGYFNLDGKTLTSGAQKEILREPRWAYQCWLASRTREFRITQVQHAVSRIDAFYRAENRMINGHFIGEYVTSEYGVAQLLDQHVNRPGHVVTTLAKSLDQLGNQLDVHNPADWGDAEEMVLLDRYLQLREGTSMTDPRKRAQTIQKHLKTGGISAKRNSYQQ